ncbi:MAG: metal-dependent hydrolase [Anaerolineaceae bacterium 4572_32.1]|nr:MAG: metal-dependent hydrolase [Anaerolineaceae bacterium 4572_32.1]
MTVKITWHGHACFSIEGGGATLLTDPFLTGNPLADVSADEVSADFILVSHAHGDHLGDAVPIAKRTGATIVSNFEIATFCGNKGANTHPLHIGGGHDFPFGRVKLTIAHHGSAFPDGGYGGSPAGFLLSIEGINIYHACDTGLFYDMKLIGEEGIDLAILPIGDNFTMGPDDALKSVKLINPKIVVPIHYNTFEVIKQDPQVFAAMVAAETSAQCKVLKPGQSLSL